ncbi:hypothetical protein V8C35DRAFT_291252 [Trichoderma chlorosporum]
MGLSKRWVDKPDHKSDTIAPQSTTVSERETEIFKWIPPPSEDFEAMSEPAPKRSRPTLAASELGELYSDGSNIPGTDATSQDNESNEYKASGYVIWLEANGGFMHPSKEGPISDDVAFCQRLLESSADTPSGTLFDDKFIGSFLNTLHNRSEARLLADLHPLLMPSAENLFIQGKEELKYVIDDYNDPWLTTEPFYGPIPQPVHAQGLKWSMFSESQRRKLGEKSGEKSLYAMRHEMYFPYLTAEIKSDNQPFEVADRQNMHSMCVALRAVASLAQAAGRLQEVHRRVLGFSISHQSTGVRIYGYYPEVVGDKVKYYRWPVRSIHLWTQADKWACYRFVEKVNSDFLPIHAKRIVDFLEQIVDPQDVPFELGVGDGVHNGSQELPRYTRAPSSQSQSLQPELRNMILELQKQLEEQKAQMEQQRVEQKEREEKLLDQLEQQRIEQKEREEKLLTLLGQRLGGDAG